MTLRGKRPSGLTSSTHVTFHHNSWTPAKADEARVARKRREDLIIQRREGRKRLSEARFGVHGWVLWFNYEGTRYQINRYLARSLSDYGNFLSDCATRLWEWSRSNLFRCSLTSCAQRIHFFPPHLSPP